MKHLNTTVRQRIYSRVLERCAPLNLKRRAIWEKNAENNLCQAAAILEIKASPHNLASF